MTAFTEIKYDASIAIRRMETRVGNATAQTRLSAHNNLRLDGWTKNWCKRAIAVFSVYHCIRCFHLGFFCLWFPLNKRNVWKFSPAMWNNRAFFGCDHETQLWRSCSLQRSVKSSTWNMLALFTYFGSFLYFYTLFPFLDRFLRQFWMDSSICSRRVH